MRRLSLLFRGPGVLAVVVLLAIGGTLATRASGKHLAVRPAPTYSAILSWNQLVRDPATGDRVDVAQVRAVTPEQLVAQHVLTAVPGLKLPKGKVWLFAHAYLRYNGHGSHRYDRRNFYAVDETGQSYATTPRLTKKDPWLGRGRITGPGGVGGLIAFFIPTHVYIVEIIWNDNNRLLPPGVAAKVLVTRRS